MIKLQTDRMISLPCGVNHIKSFAISHCNFYFLDCSGCKLIRWSPDTQKIETVTLERKYLCFCYDHKENCYWAVPECEPYLICRLDACFYEVGNITIKGACQQRPVSLCCDACGNGLWICYPCHLAYIEKHSKKVNWDKNDDNKRINLGLMVQGKCRAICYDEGSRQILELSSQCEAETLEICFPKTHKFVGIEPFTCKHICGECRFYVLLLKICSRELILAEYCIDFSKRTLKPCCSPDLCPPDPCPPHPCPPKPCPPELCPPKPFPPEPHCGGIYEVMHSIALEEAGISHILNAEGEKIQKAVATSSNIEQLICVNESVKRTLTQVTLLEGMLYSKLEALVSYYDCCHPQKPDPPCPSSPPFPCSDYDDCNDFDNFDDCNDCGDCNDFDDCGDCHNTNP